MIEYKTSWQLRKVITRRHHYYYGEHQTKIVVFRNGREISSELQHRLNQIAKFFKTDPTTRKWWYKSEATLMRMAIAAFEAHTALDHVAITKHGTVYQRPLHETECCNRRLCNTCNRCLPCCNRASDIESVKYDKDRCYCKTPGCYTDKCPHRQTPSDKWRYYHDYDR